jgi:hypothetical protein
MQIIFNFISLSAVYLILVCMVCVKKTQKTVSQIIYVKKQGTKDNQRPESQHLSQGKLYFFPLTSTPLLQGVQFQRRDKCVCDFAAQSRA